MTRNNFVIFSVLLSLLAIVSLGTACDYLPALWCSSKDIASKCKVIDQCQEFVWNRNGGDDHYWSNEKPVDIGFYYEVLCPDCKDFMEDQLWGTYKAIPDIFLVDFVPYGNAEENFVDGKWVFTCQHGEEECFGNMLHTCALHAYPRNITFPFIACMEMSNEASVEETGKKCAGEQGLSFTNLMKCVNSKKGNQLQHEMAVKTKSLDPPHEYVPWITINGMHTEAIQEEASKDLLGLICRTYKGPKPSACKDKVKRRGCMKVFE